jgi:hypothetical protein
MLIFYAQIIAHTYSILIQGITESTNQEAVEQLLDSEAKTTKQKLEISVSVSISPEQEAKTSKPESKTTEQEATLTEQEAKTTKQEARTAEVEVKTTEPKETKPAVPEGFDTPRGFSR